MAKHSFLHWWPSYSVLGFINTLSHLSKMRLVKMGFTSVCDQWVGQREDQLSRDSALMRLWRLQLLSIPSVAKLCRLAVPVSRPKMQFVARLPCLWASVGKDLHLTTHPVRPCRFALLADRRLGVCVSSWATIVLVNPFLKRDWFLLFSMSRTTDLFYREEKKKELFFFVFILNTVTSSTERERFTKQKPACRLGFFTSFLPCSTRKLAVIPFILAPPAACVLNR